jgi:DNA-binding transcriptional MerR regulator
MTTLELCESTGLTAREVQNWLNNGLLKAELVNQPGSGGPRREFTDDQAAHARLLKALHAKGAKLSQLARATLPPAGQASYVVFDGRELRSCRDASSAIAAVVRARR